MVNEASAVRCLAIRSGACVHCVVLDIVERNFSSRSGRSRSTAPNIAQTSRMIVVHRLFTETNVHFGVIVWVRRSETRLRARSACERASGQNLTLGNRNLNLGAGRYAYPMATGLSCAPRQADVPNGEEVGSRTFAQVSSARYFLKSIRIGMR